MTISIIIGILVLIVFVFGWSYCYENVAVGLIIIAFSVFGAYSCATNSTLEKQREEAEAEDAATEKLCRKPKLVSSINGVDLYRYDRACNDPYPVYFSKSGTIQEQCIRRGKHTECKNVSTPNSEGIQ